VNGGVTHGVGEIRTHEGLSPLAVFKAPFTRSGGMPTYANNSAKMFSRKPFSYVGGRGRMLVSVPRFWPFWMLERT